MKWIIYKVKSTMQVFENEEVVDKEIICEAKTEYSEEKLEYVKTIAVNEPTIEDDGQPEPEPTPSGGDSAVWDELDAAYQKGVDSV